MLLRNIQLRQGYQVEVTAAERGGKTSQRSKDLGFAWVYNRLLRAEVVGGTVSGNGGLESNRIETFLLRLLGARLSL